MLFVSDVITDFHLLLDKVLRLDEGADELVSLLSLQVPHLVLVDDIGNFERFLLRLEFVLLVD